MKEKILKYLITDLEKSVITFENAIAELKGLSDMDENATKDPEDFSHQNVSRDMEMRYNVQLEQARHDLVAVQQLMNRENKTIAPGALIETDKRWFFVGLSSPAIKVEEKELICFTTSAPVYRLLVGKKAGDDFSLGKEKYQILNIF